MEVVIIISIAILLILLVLHKAREHNRNCNYRSLMITWESKAIIVGVILLAIVGILKYL